MEALNTIIQKLDPILALLFGTSFLIVIVFWLLKAKSCWKLLKKTPFWFLFLNAGLLLYKLFLTEHYFTSRREFGMWILSLAKMPPWRDILTHHRAPVNFAITKFFSGLFQGVGYEFMVGLHAIFAFVNAICIYWIGRIFFQNKKIGIISSIFYLSSFSIFSFSLTVDYTNTAIFFAIQAIFFGALYYQKRNLIFLIPGIAASILAIGARPEYIIFGFIFFVFLAFFAVERKKIILSTYSLLLLPKIIDSFHVFIQETSNDPYMHGETYTTPNILQRSFAMLSGHFQIFISNLGQNLGTLLNFFTLTGVFSLLFLFGVLLYAINNFRKKESLKHKKPILFFALYLLILFFFYSLFHAEGLFNGFKYISSLIPPLVVLAAIATVKLNKLIPLSDIFIPGIIFAYFLAFLLIPTTKGMPLNPPSLYLIKESTPQKTEYEKYRSLSYKNRPYKFFYNKNADIETGESNYFISNSLRTMLYTMPFNKKVHHIQSKRELEDSIKRINPGSTIYISQGEVGFKQSGYHVDGFKAMDPKKFEKEILKQLQLEEKLISYYLKDLHVYLYKMKKTVK